MAEKNAMLVMRDVSKTFNPGTVNEKCALKNLNLTLKQGDFATIVGSNGAGKSTLFNAITGVFFADKGLIMLDGEDITYQKEHVRSKVIGHLFQDPLKGTAPHMTIEENMALAYLRTTTSKNAYFSRIKAADKKKFREQLAGCGSSLEADTNTVYVSKHGKVVSMDVEQLDQSYYDETELKEFVDSAVDEYNTENGKNSVKVDDLTVEDGTAKLRMDYETVDDYTAFNGVELYEGKIVQALAAGYDFDTDFAGVDKDGSVTGVTRWDILAQEDLKVVIIKANTDVKIDGKILYVSCDNVTVTGKDSVSIKEGTGIEKTWITEAEEVPSTEAVLETESTEDAGDVIEGEVIIGTEEASGNDVVTNLSGGSSGTDVYTYIIYK